MKIKEALVELRSARSALHSQLFQRRTLAEKIALVHDASQTAHAPDSYATVISDTLNALERIDAAIDVLENEPGDVINVLAKAIHCLKSQTPSFKPSARTLQ